MESKTNAQFKMPKLKNARSVLAVNDLRTSVAFYCKVLGFSIDAEYEGWCFLSRDGIQLMLGHCPDEVPARQINDHSYFAYIEVQGVDELFQEFVARGLTPFVPPESKPWGMREFVVTTPDGHRIMFGQDLDAGQRAMSEAQSPVAVVAADVPLRIKPSVYPEPFATQMLGRTKSQLGEFFGLANFGVNLTRLAPHSVSALRHAHTKQDEFVYILQGYPTLHSDEGHSKLGPGMCAGFKAGTGNGHHLINETAEEVVYLEIGDRSPGDEGSYPDDDLQAVLVDGKWKFAHKDGTHYE